MKREIRDARDGFADVTRQLGVHHQILTALRAETRGDLARIEQAMLEGFERLEARMLSIMTAIGGPKTP